nr:immunoglobulin heavy chain junction region [Mus musculus]
CARGPWLLDDDYW